MALRLLIRVRAYPFFWASCGARHPDQKIQQRSTDSDSVSLDNDWRFPLRSCMTSAASGTICNPSAMEQCSNKLPKSPQGPPVEDIRRVPDAPYALDLVDIRTCTSNYSFPFVNSPSELSLRQIALMLCPECFAFRVTPVIGPPFAKGVIDVYVHLIYPLFPFYSA